MIVPILKLAVNVCGVLLSYGEHKSYEQFQHGSRGKGVNRSMTTCKAYLGKFQVIIRVFSYLQQSRAYTSRQ
jgi:hypothetical protein